MSQEDEMVNNLIERHRSDCGSSSDLRVEPEAHYNYYGDRGVADLYVRRTAKKRPRDRTDRIYEVKSNAALDEVSGANEILRQFNRMRRYFYKDEGRSFPKRYEFELCFVISEETVRHVAENIQVYKSAQQEKLGPDLNQRHSDQDGATITLRPPSGEITPARIVSFAEDDLNPRTWKKAMGAMGTAGAPLVEDILDDLGY